MKPLELWGGYECTVNRVGDRWFDQTPRSGHEDRIEDLQLFADLGMTSLRYPALWERVSPQAADQQDFRWLDERLPELHRLGLNPILTLCHHGSGPHYTSLIQDSFAPGLARHAAAVAARYPWVRDWTPVNEPLTTARFSALYGYWYPHTRDEGLFWTALLNEIDATRLSMKAIRAVNPAARLIQTDDLGYCHATEPLQCEAEYQNARRWMGWDLLCGMVVPGHALWNRVASFGLADRLHTIADDPCPPDVIGINHYLASERWLDHRIELHPDRALADREVGSCGGVPFVDVDAIRTRREGVLGLPALLRQAHERYDRTISVTEVHNGATREEQVRWFVEVWDACEALRADGVDICAVTAWSLLGSHDWNRMVTRFIGHYETGVYDVRTGSPRPTLLASVLRDLAAGRRPEGPWQGTGWWKRELRFIGDESSQEPQFECAEAKADRPAPLMIVGDGGTLERLAVQACEARGLAYVRAKPDEHRKVATCRPWAVLDATDREGLCGRASSPRAAAFAAECRNHAIVMARLTGKPSWTLVEEGEHLLTIRTAPIYTAWKERERAVEMLDALDDGQPISVHAGGEWTRVYGPDLIDGIIDLLLDGTTGSASFHVGERMSEAEFASALAMVADARPDLVREIGVASNPLFGWSNKPSFLPPTESTLERFVRERRAVRRTMHAGWRLTSSDLQAAE